MYYNDAVKHQYIATLKSKNQIASFFSTSQPFEDELQIDVGAMPDEKVLEIFQTTNPVNVMSVKSQLPGINSYRRWYRAHFDDWDRNQAEKLTYQQVDIATPMRNTLIRSWSEIMDELREIEYDFSQGVEAAPILALLWLGITVQDAVLLKKTQVDCVNGLIFDAKGVLLVRNIEPEILDVLRAYQNTKQAKRKHNQNEDVFATNSSYFIHRMDAANSKKVADEPRHPLRMTKQIQDFALDYKNKTGKQSKMDTRRVLYSGNLHRLYEYMQTNPNTKDLEVQLEMKRLIGNVTMLTGDVLYMYEQYKKAFDL